MHAQIAQRAAAALLRIEHPWHAPIAIAVRMAVDDAEIAHAPAGRVAECLDHAGDAVHQRDRNEAPRVSRGFRQRRDIGM